MKKYFVIASTFLALALTACGGKHDQVYAVDALEEAQATALANAPTAEPIVFGDEDKSSVSTATDSTKAQSDDAKTEEATAEEATAEAVAEEATKSDTAEATAETE